MVRKAVKIRFTEAEKEIARTRKRTNKLGSLRNEFERNAIKDFEQVFAIISETSLASELGISFYNFRKKVHDPSEFTVGEMMRFANLIGVSYALISDFILDRIRSRKPMI